MATVEHQMIQTSSQMAARRKRQAWRRQKNRLALLLSMATMAFGLFWLCWILFTTVSRGIEGLSWSLFTEMTPPPGAAGGLLNPIMGSKKNMNFLYKKPRA